jgi:8-oxo-dGTP diphosphatase
MEKIMKNKSLLTEYVVGFNFIGPEQRRQVVLIQKIKPAWQAGLFNGVGGKIEANETPLAAMVREYREETGELITHWEPFCTQVFKEAVVHFFKAFNDETTARTTTKESIAIFDMESLFETPKYFIPNLLWLIPMALHTRDKGTFTHDNP